MAQEDIVLAAHVINAYFWEKMKDFYPTYWSGTRMPIIPAQQLPEFQESGSPYLVYVNSVGPTGHLFGLQNETTHYTVYSSEPDRISGIIKLARNLFDRKDVSAQRVNSWLRAQPASRWGTYTDDYKNFSFRTISLEGATGAQPATESGGKHDGILQISFTYVNRKDPFENAQDPYRDITPFELGTF